jgi:hypothetical protein
MLLASLKILTTFKKLAWKPHHNIYTGYSLCHWSIFSTVNSSLDAGGIRVNLHEVACGMIFQEHRRVPVSVFRASEEAY